MSAHAKGIAASLPLFVFGGMLLAGVLNLLYGGGLRYGGEFALVVVQGCDVDRGEA